ncbi:M23 family metallopeptidase [Sphingomonas sp. Tas61C01]|uniref:M23 family metallopeptidase n=1 Tax=Sphingomonas sp. Tas61C01 TaxID=3458297 RepID=UPI00403ED201
MIDRRAVALAAAVAIPLAGCVAPVSEVTPVAAAPLTSAPVPAPIPLTPFRWQGTISQGGLIRAQAPGGTATVTFDGRPVPIAADGAFVIGFDRDAPASATLVATLGDGRRVAQQLTIAPRAWRIERLTTLPRFPAPDPIFARMRPPELAAIAAARVRVTSAAGWRQPFAWPATGRISGLFGAQRIYRGEPGAYHGGVDVAKPTGAIIRAPADGVVILAADRPYTLEGKLLMIDHGLGLNSAFLHLSRIDVREGQVVRRGDPIGLVGATGRATGPHLHWGLRWGEARLDPMLVAGPMPVD